MDNFHKIVELENKAITATANQNYEEAVQFHNIALDIALKLNRPRLVAVLCNRLGDSLEASNQIQRAVVVYESGLKALQNEPQSDLDWVIDSLRNAVKGFDQRHEFLEILDLYSETTSDDIIEAEKDTLLAVKLLINIGNAYLRQPQMNPALNAYEQALNRPEITNAPTLRAHALTHIAIIERRSGDIDSAVQKLDQALDILESHPDPHEKRRALSSLAGIYRERGEKAQALTTYHQALELYKEAEDPLGEARALASVGHIYLNLEKYLEAKQSFQRSVSLAQQVRDEDTLWHANWGLGCCQHIAGELDDAAQSFRTSLDKIKGRQRELRTDEGKVTFLESVQDIYDHLISVHLDRAGSQTSAFADALIVAEEARGQAMFELMGVRRRRFPSRQTGIRDTRLRTEEQRSESLSQSAAGIASTPMDFNPMAQMAPAVQSAPSLDFMELLNEPVWGEDTIGISDMVETAQAIPSTIPRWPEEQKNTVEIENELQKQIKLARVIYHVLSDRTAVFAVSREGLVEGAVIPFGRMEITARVAEVRKALQVEVDPRDFDVEETEDENHSTTSESGLTLLLQGLYADLIEPIAKNLPMDNLPVVIEPHASLWMLPFAALISPDEIYLADRWPLLFSPSQQVLDEIRSEPDYGSPKNLKPLIVGNPTMPSLKNKKGISVRLPPLPGAEEECRIINNLFPDQESVLLLGDSADWANVITQMPLHGILHFATHGLAFSDEPLDSLLALGVPNPNSMDALQQHPTFNTWPQSKFLSDFIPSAAQNGLLTARQIVYLPIPADLVTLSACQTGLGQISGDGIIGLSRSFLVAGARSVMVSQWSVNDQATALLMAAFYREYIRLDDKALALQKAIQEIRLIPGFEHPRFWAPFVIVGVEA